MVEVGIESAGCVWAPEAVWCKEENKWFVFFASCVKERDNEDYKQRIYGCFTEDFKSFSPTFKYIDAKTDVIDTSIIWHDGFYYRFSKDETSKCILMAKSKSLSGEFEIVDSSLSEVHGVEGPQCCQLSDGRWCLFLDQYGANAGYAPFVTDDLDKGQFKKIDADFHTEIQFRHGGVLTITMEEYDRLMKAFS